MIGRRLTEALQQRGGTAVSWLVRNTAVEARKDVSLIKWNVEQRTIDKVGDVTHVVYLAGFPLANGRLDEAHKQQCEVSRIEGAKLLCSALTGRGLDAFVGVSAIGFYGWGNDEKSAAAKESDPPGDDWAAVLCAKWEQEYAKFGANRSVVIG